MQLKDKITHLVSNRSAAEHHLSADEILDILQLLKPISKNKALIEKCILLLHAFGQVPKSNSKLTKRENQVFNLIGTGLSSKDIAELLQISSETVGTHRKNIIKKLELTGTGNLQKIAFQQNNIETCPGENTR
ncbi:MAG: LuxR C-terminal-related transcriptional regulator [Marinirhabdus sp.]|nr:LuxR C-terminal-related transcriptional regulator [Marinirhabdus sp.]